jgi:mannose-6-phosphate isomerase class I
MNAPLDSALALAPRYRTRVGGGTALAARFGRQIPAELRGAKDPVGESWELCDFPAPTAGSPDDGSARSAVAAGPLPGTTLAQLRQTRGRELMGDLPVNPATGGFPLLLKYLDAAAALDLPPSAIPVFKLGIHPQRDQPCAVAEA